MRIKIEKGIILNATAITVAMACTMTINITIAFYVITDMNVTTTTNTTIGTVLAFDFRQKRHICAHRHLKKEVYCSVTDVAHCYIGCLPS